MSQLNPSRTTALDICTAGLNDANILGVGQTPLAEDLTKAQARLQWMLQQWERKRWIGGYHLVDMAFVSTGATSYTIGPGGNFDTGTSSQFTAQFGSQFGNAQQAANPIPQSARPSRIESSFLRQIQAPPSQNSSANPYGRNLIDYPMVLLQSREDYNRIALKTLMSFPGYLFYDSAWPTGLLYPWPVPQPNIYELHVTVMCQLPVAFQTAAAVIDLPYEYYAAMVTNLAIWLRAAYGVPTFPGDPLPGLAKNALNTLRGANTQIARLQMPGDLIRPQLYNIFSDRMY